MKAKRFWIILLSILLSISICVNVFILYQLNIFVKTEASYARSNHYLANIGFLRNLSQNRISISRISEEEDSEYKIANWTICVNSLKKVPEYFGSEGYEGLNNYVYHNNNIALKFACHLLLSKQKEVGFKVIEVLSKVSPSLAYHSPKRKSIGIAAIKQAALEYVNNNQSHQAVINSIEFQWQFRALDFEWVLSDEFKKGIRFRTPNNQLKKGLADLNWEE